MKPMLADPAKEIRFPVYASAKIDGVRAIIKDGQVLSRSLKPIPNRHIQRTIGHPELDGLDGELTVGLPWAPNVMQATTSGVMAQHGEPVFTYWVFDFWNNTTMPFSERYRIMMHAQRDGVFAGQDRVLLLPQTLIHSEAELNAFEETVLEQGYEGIMVRSPTGIYKYGRSTAKEGYLLKVKRWTDAEATIVGFQEKMHNGNEATLDELGNTKRSSHQANLVPMNTLGAFLVRAADGTEFKVSPGVLTHPERQKVWDERVLYLGSLLTYKTFTATGVKDKPRFNVFKAFRDRLDL